MVGLQPDGYPAATVLEEKHAECSILVSAVAASGLPDAMAAMVQRHFNLRAVHVRLEAKSDGSQGSATVRQGAGAQAKGAHPNPLVAHLHGFAPKLIASRPSCHSCCTRPASRLSCLAAPCRAPVQAGAERDELAYRRTGPNQRRAASTAE